MQGRENENALLLLVKVSIDVEEANSRRSQYAVPRSCEGTSRRSTANQILHVKSDGITMNAEERTDEIINWVGRAERRDRGRGRSRCGRYANVWGT